VLLENLHLVTGGIAKVNSNALLNEVELLFFPHLVLCAVPHVAGVFRAVSVAWLGAHAQNKELLLVFNVFEVENCAGVLQVRVRKQFSLVEVLLSQLLAVLLNLFSGSLALSLFACHIQLHIKFQSKFKQQRPKQKWRKNLRR
jgi:hypothetical protein